MTRRPHVLFVDDEPRILGGLRRMLRVHRDRWDMSFVDGGEAALAVIRERPCDVIVSDYRMPGMDGAQLLERVRSDSPGTARVILSGQTNEDNLLRIMVLAHDVLTKPTTPEQLVATVDRLIEVRVAASGMAESLPSAPHTLVELVAALDEENASPESVGAVIERDPAATARVLQLVNSSAYTAGRTVSNVSQAVAVLGLHTVRGLVLMHDLVRSFDADEALPPTWIDDLTCHSVETSRLARSLAAGREWESHAFTAGLLHEIGQLVLASSRPGSFGEVLTTWRPDGVRPADALVPLCVAEVSAFGFSHLDVGVKLLRLWGLPTPVTEAIAGHPGASAPAAADDPSSALTLAHLVVEGELGAVCGPCHGPAAPDETEWAEPVRDAVSRWRQEWRQR